MSACLSEFTLASSMLAGIIKDKRQVEQGLAMDPERRNLNKKMEKVGLVVQVIVGFRQRMEEADGDDLEREISLVPGSTITDLVVSISDAFENLGRLLYRVDT